MPEERNSLHISKADNEDAAEYLATKSAGDMVEMRVQGQIREISDGGAVIDITSAEGTDFEAPPSPEDSSEAEVIGSVLGAPPSG